MLKLLPDDFSLDKYGLHVRLVEEVDSDFIVKIRLNPKVSLYMHKADNDVEKQREWICKYKEREKRGEDFYFLFELPDGTPQGVSRIYNINENSFTTGSWVFDTCSRPTSAILGDILTKEIGFELYPDSVCHWDNNKSNLNVLKYSKLYNPTIERETNDTIYFSCTKENSVRMKNRVLRMLVK